MLKLVFTLLLILNSKAYADESAAALPEVEKTYRLLNELKTNPSRQRRDELRMAFQGFRPSGYRYIDGLLKIAAEDPALLKVAYHGRSVVLKYAQDAILDRQEKAKLKSQLTSPSVRLSIQQSLRALLNAYSNPSALQDEIVGIFETLDLWDEKDLSFLMRRAFGGVGRARYIYPLWKNLDKISGEDREVLRQKLRGSSKRDIIAYILYYKLGGLKVDDMVFFLKRLALYIEPERLGPRRVDSSVLYPVAGVSAFVDIETQRQLSRVVEETLQDLHHRLKGGDSELKEAYHYALNGWSILAHTDREKAYIESFFTNLSAGHFPRSCVRALESSAGGQ